MTLRMLRLSAACSAASCTSGEAPPLPDTMSLLLAPAFSADAPLPSQRLAVAAALDGRGAALEARALCGGCGVAYAGDDDENEERLGCADCGRCFLAVLASCCAAAAAPRSSASASASGLYVAPLGSMRREG